MDVLKVTGLVLLLIVYGECNMECIECDSALNINDCLRNKVTCGPSEKCFLEKITTSSLQIVYNAGCRSDTVCNIMKQLGAVAAGRKKRDLVNCAQCCSTLAGDALPCNARLCSQKPNVTTTSECMNCPDGVSSVNACKNTVVCQDTEICSTSIKWDALPRYIFGCEHRETCKKFIQEGVETGVGPGSRRASSLLLCSACCSGDKCNKEECFRLRKNMTVASLGTNPPPTVSG